MGEGEGEGEGESLHLDHSGKSSICFQCWAVGVPTTLKILRN